MSGVVVTRVVVVLAVTAISVAMVIATAVRIVKYQELIGEIGETGAIIVEIESINTKDKNVLILIVRIDNTPN